MLDAAFVPGELGQGVGTGAIDVEGAGQEVAFVGRRGRRCQLAITGSYFIVVQLLAGAVGFGDVAQAVAVDAGFHREGAVEAPLIGGDTPDQLFFAVADAAGSGRRGRGGG